MGYKEFTMAADCSGFVLLVKCSCGGQSRGPVGMFDRRLQWFRRGLLNE